MADKAFDALVTAGGTATITVRTNTRTRRWIVEQISTELVGATAAPLLANCRKNGRLVSPFLAQSDTMGSDPPVTLEPFDVLTLEWTGISPVGAVARGTIYYDEQRIA